MKVSSFGLSTAEIREELAPLRSDFSIAVCRAKNPFNIGAIIRTAHSFLVKEIFLIGSEPYYERAAMGMQKYENIVEHPDEATFLAAVAGRHLVGVERDHARRTLWEAPFPPGMVPSQPPRTKRRQVKNACTNCQKACKKCDDARPCLRCVKYGVAEECVDSQRKERQKGLKRGRYKKRDGRGE